MFPYSSEWSAKQKDVRFGSVVGIVLPSPTLLHTNTPPFTFGKSAVLGQTLRNVFREYDMSILKISVLIFIRIFNLGIVTKNNVIFQILDMLCTAIKLKVELTLDISN